MTDRMTMHQLTPDHLLIYQHIDAVVGDESDRVWDARRLPPFVGAYVDVPLTKTLLLEGESFDAIRQYIAKVDPYGERRIV